MKRSATGPAHLSPLRATATPTGAADVPEATPISWYALQPDEAVVRLETVSNGLTDSEAGRRLELWGPNEVEAEQPLSRLSLVLHQFRSPLIYLLLAAGVITLALDHYSDAVVILLVVVTNAIIGYTQEARAHRELRSLQRLGAPRAEVLRDGASRVVETRTLVPGDVVLLASGARVPADLRLLEVRSLEVDESALTGESLPAGKGVAPLPGEPLVPADQSNMAFAGTVVTRGRAKGVVVRTGSRSELGRLAAAVRALGTTATPLQARMERLGRSVGLAVIGLALMAGAIGLLRGMPRAEILLVAIAMAVSAVPEGLPAVLTITLAIGVRRMARRNAIVRHLPAVETLGSTTVIGSDKTGTLTRNEMTVRSIWAGGRRYEVSGIGYAPEGAIEHEGERVIAASDAALERTLLIGLLANESAPPEAGEEPRGDPTEIALYVSASKGGLDPAAVRPSHWQLDLWPFESERRMMATLDDGPEGRHLHLKGAPEVVLARCTHELRDQVVPLQLEHIRDAVAEFGALGLRVLAFAYRREDTRDRIQESDLAGGFVFAGLQALSDPVRPEAVAAVAAARAAGIRVVMLTGDHLETGQAVAQDVGLSADPVAVEGAALDGMTDAELDELVRRVDVYARVAPEHKLRIVRRLREQGEVVAITGDGVNDAPALRAAHLGIAMGASGTDVAREAADMVLRDDNFASITAAVEEGRVVFANIRKVTFFLLSTGVGEVITILVAILAGWPVPFLAVQILWINLVTNGLQDVALAFEPGEPGLLRRPPRPPSEGMLTPRLLARLGGVGIVLAAGTLLVFWWVWQQTGDVELARSAAVTQMVVFQFYHVFNCRSLDRSILSVPLLSNPFLFVSFVAAALAHLAVLHVSWLQRLFGTVELSALDWLAIIAIGSSVTLAGELDKAINRRRGRLIG
jgi:magnesium-transporting ATPase (P-type)